MTGFCGFMELNVMSEAAREALLRPVDHNKDLARAKASRDLWMSRYQEVVAERDQLRFDAEVLRQHKRDLLDKLYAMRIAFDTICNVIQDDEYE